MALVKFEDLLIHNSDFLKPFAVSLTNDNEAAKDLYQETIYKALVSQEKYNANTNLKGWLYTIMRNIFINDYRRRVRQLTVINKSPSDFLLSSTQAITPNVAISNLNIKEIEKAIDRLPKIFKIPFTLYFEGDRYSEIAEALNEPLGTIKSRIHFARKLLKEQITRY